MVKYAEGAKRKITLSQATPVNNLHQMELVASSQTIQVGGVH